MKPIFLFLIALIWNSNSFAGSIFTFEISVFGENKREALSGIQLDFTFNESSTERHFTDQNGMAKVTREEKIKTLEIVIVDLTGTYRNTNLFLDSRVLKENNTRTVVLYLAPDFNALYAELRKKDEAIMQELISSVADTTVHVFEGPGCKAFNEASFSGGSVELQRFINQNINYPQYSIEMNEQGRIYLKFIIEADGTISHLTVERGVSPDLDYESVRVMSTMPRWIPATCDGKAVRSYGRMPIMYNLE